MSSEVIGIIGIVVLIVLIACRMWIGVAMGLVGFIGLVIMEDLGYALNIVGSAPYSNLFSYTLTVIPMFTLMGMFISESKIGTKLYGAAEVFVGHFRGGLASATVIACGILGAITGGHYGATVIMSKLALPEMRKRGYSDQLAGASIASAAPLAIIIPPSVSLIFFGVLTETSISSLFYGRSCAGDYADDMFLYSDSNHMQEKTGIGSGWGKGWQERTPACSDRFDSCNYPDFAGIGNGIYGCLHNNRIGCDWSRRGPYYRIVHERCKSKDVKEMLFLILQKMQV